GGPATRAPAPRAANNRHGSYNGKPPVSGGFLFLRHFTSRVSLRRGGGAPAEVAQAAVDPLLGQLLLRAVLRQAAAQGREIDAVEILVLVEAGEHHRLGAGRRVVMALQA